MDIAVPADDEGVGKVVQGLIDQLVEIDDKLDRLLGGEVDSVRDARGRTILLRRAQLALRENDDAKQAAILNTLPAQLAVLDGSGRIVSVNEPWRQFARNNGLRQQDYGLGQDYLSLCDRAAADGSEEGRLAGECLRAVLAGQRGSFTLEYPCHAPHQQRWFMLRAMPMEDVPGGGVVVMHIDITEKKKDAEELQRLAEATGRRERLFSTMLSSITDLTYATDRQGRVLYANTPTLRLWGLTLPEALGRTVHGIGYPQHLADRVQAQIERVFQTGRPLLDETGFPGPDGELGYYEYIFAPAFAPDGSVEFMVGCSREITARKHSEQALRQSVARFQTLASAMPQIVWAANELGEWVYLNEQWTDYTGRSRHDAHGTAWLEQVHPDDRQGMSATYAAALRSGQDFSIEARLLRQDGSSRWCLMRGVPVREEAGRVAQWIGTCTDIDELKTAELRVSKANRELQRQRTELRTLFDLVPAMVWFKDTQGRILQLNSRAAASAGLSVQEAVGRNVAELHPQNAPAYAQEDREIVRTHRPILGKLERIVDETGTERWFQSDKVPFHDEDGTVRGIMVMKQDITERQRVQDALHDLNSRLELRVQERTAELAQAREEAERANSAKSAFLAAMSHEIRTPMAGLLGLLELLELTDLDEEQLSTLAVARDSGRSLKQIMDTILDFARIEAESLELDLTTGSVASVVESICRLHGPVAAGKSLSLQASVDPAISASHRFDRLRLGQILGNLVGNALKFTAQGSVTVQLESAGRSGGKEHLRLVVRDTGIGIPADRVDKLFQPYVQADARTSTTYGGTGLGLFIARRLAELMDGTLVLESEPGRGTTLTLAVSFEVCEEAAVPESSCHASRERLNSLVAERPAAPTVQEAQARGDLLLVVDDHPTNRMLLLRQVSALGYAAEAAADGAQALKAWESGRFAAILTDCNMPRMNGFELAREIRLRESGLPLHTPIIGCTANALASAAQECLLAGMDDAVTKPVALVDLCETLDRWLPLKPAAPGKDVEGGPYQAMLARSPGGGDGLVDLALLDAIRGGDAGSRQQVIEAFRRTNAADMAKLRLLLSRRSFEEVADTAHRLRGACAMMGATCLADACASVQAAAERHEPGKVHAAMALVEAELHRLDEYLVSLA